MDIWKRWQYNGIKSIITKYKIKVYLKKKNQIFKAHSYCRQIHVEKNTLQVDYMKYTKTVNCGIMQKAQIESKQP